MLTTFCVVVPAKYWFGRIMRLVSIWKPFFHEKLTCVYVPSSQRARCVSRAITCDMINVYSFDGQLLGIVVNFRSLLAAWGMKKIITKAEKLPNDGYYLPKSLQFEAKKQISIKDKVVVDMLSSHKLLCWVVTDPDMKDNPIVYSSPGFCRYTGYSKIEIEGRNCRFLQGKDTKKEDVDAIRLAIREKREESVCLLNYRKDGRFNINTNLNNLSRLRFRLSYENSSKIVLLYCHAWIMYSTLMQNNLTFRHKILQPVLRHADVWSKR